MGNIVRGLEISSLLPATTEIGARMKSLGRAEYEIDGENHTLVFLQKLVSSSNSEVF